MPISEQYLNSPCEMKSMDGELILHGYINRITDDGIEIVGNGDRLPVIHCNTVVKLSVFHRVLSFKVLIGKVYLSTEEMIRVVDLQLSADYEKRNFFRVKVHLPCSVLPVTKNEEGGGNCGCFFPATVENMSLGGLFFLCSEELEEGGSLIVRLKLYDTDYSILCKILRKDGNSGQEQKYGCVFLDNTGRQFDVICKYLFERQREQIRIMKQMQP